MLYKLSGIQLLQKLNEAVDYLLFAPQNELNKKRYRDVYAELLRRLEVAEKDGNPWQPGKQE